MGFFSVLTYVKAKCEMRKRQHAYNIVVTRLEPSDCMEDALLATYVESPEKDICKTRYFNGYFEVDP